MNQIGSWISERWTLLLPLVLGAAAVGWLLPRRQPRRPAAGVVLGAAALVAAAFGLFAPAGAVLSNALFYLFALTAIAAAASMVTSRSPVYAALWFAVTTLSVCGLFLLRSAPFLAAATVIVYAGAIVVTFLFVIMLAQQAGEAESDRESHQPWLATLAAFVLLGGLLVPLRDRIAQGEVARPPAATAALVPGENPPPGTLRGLGRTLFGQYLFAVELAGTLLLTAAIGAIAIAPKKNQGPGA
jgi:NADH-quinone oxidoreductase subunit J